jgi:hypothetical protein
MVKPARLILDESFRYVPAVATSVAETWRRFGWRPTTDEERKTRRGPAAERLVDEVAAVKAAQAADREPAGREPRPSANRCSSRSARRADAAPTMSSRGVSG